MLRHLSSIEPLSEPKSGEESEEVVGVQLWKLPIVHTGEKEMRPMGSGGLQSTNEDPEGEPSGFPKAKT